MWRTVGGRRVGGGGGVQAGGGGGTHSETACSHGTPASIVLRGRVVEDLSTGPKALGSIQDLVS